MIRKAAIAFLFLLTCGSVVLCAVSYWKPIDVSFSFPSQSQLVPARWTPGSLVGHQFVLDRGDVSVGDVYKVCGVHDRWERSFAGWGIEHKWIWKSPIGAVEKRLYSGSFWTFPVLLSLASVATLLRMLLRRRSKPGHCRMCSYDLTGNVSGVCPECGSSR